MAQDRVVDPAGIVYYPQTAPGSGSSPFDRQVDPLGPAPGGSPGYGNKPQVEWYGRAYLRMAFQRLAGRLPTVGEEEQFLPSYMGEGDAGKQAGDSAVAQFLRDQASLPVNQRQKWGENAGQYSGDVNAIYQDLLKRGATDAEAKHFGTMLASGEVDPYELRSFVEATPEYQNARDATFRQQVGTELGDLDTKAFGRQKEDVLSRFAQAGRLGSSALDFALTDLMGKIAEKRQGFLANLSANQYQGNKENARADYGNLLNQLEGNTAYERGMGDIYRTRGWNVADYNRQASDYERYLQQSKKQPNWMDYTAFGLNALNSLVNTGKSAAQMGGPTSAGGFGFWG